MCDAIMLFVFIYDATYFLLVFALNMWRGVGIGESFLKYMYELMTHPPLVFFNAICLFLFPAALSVMVNFDSLSPVRSFTFDRQRNLLTIESYCFFWHRRIEYSLNEIQSLQWFPQSVYAGGMTMVDIQLLKLIRRKPNGKTHLIPIRHAVPKCRNLSNVVDLIHEFLTPKNQH